MSGREPNDFSAPTGRKDTERLRKEARLTKQQEKHEANEVAQATRVGCPLLSGLVTDKPA